MEYKDSFKKALIGLAILLVASLAITLFIKVILKDKNPESAQTADQIPLNAKTDVPVSQLPKNIPTDLPQEEDVSVVDNYNVAMQGGGDEGARMYLTKKSIDENVKIYSDYLEQKGWVDISLRSYPNLKVISAKKGSQNMLINISDSQDKKTSTVSIYVSET